jgi:hypothetical protein
VRFVTKDGLNSAGTGDLYLNDMTPIQRRRFFDCATSSLLSVYEATGKALGPVGAPEVGLSSVDPTSDACFSQRATNVSLVRGMAIELKVAGVQSTIPLDARFSSWMVPQVARASGKVPVSKKQRNEFRFSLERVTTMARLVAKDDPSGTSLAEGGLGSFVGVEPNGAYPTPATSEDPPLPWGPLSSNARGVTLARTFHRAHTREWCAAMTKSSLEGLRTRAQDSTLSDEGRAVACRVCSEFAARHVRIGTAQSWDAAQEPVCLALMPSAVALYTQGPGTPEQLAQRWCCP